MRKYMKKGTMLYLSVLLSLEGLAGAHFDLCANPLKKLKK